MIEVVSARHDWFEKAGFALRRKNGGTPDYIFLLFHQPMELMIGDTLMHTAPDAFIIYHLDTPQYFASRNADLRHDWMHLRGDVAALLAECGLEFDRVYYPDITSAVTEGVYNIERELFGDAQFKTELCDTYVRQIFYKIARAVSSNEPRSVVPANVRESFTSLRDIMLSDSSKRINIKDAAAESGLSPSRFQALYKDIFGISPVNDMIRARIERARNMLTGGNFTVEECAEALGYTNVYHFIRQFKKHTGVTPGKFAGRQ